MNSKLILKCVLLLCFSFQIWAEEPDSETEPLADDTPVSHEEIQGEKNLTGSRPWRAPDYSNQEKTLGWSENAFETPKGMESQVKFWIDIYSKYNTDQGVLHDSENINFIYKVLDFTEISRRTDLSEVRKEITKRNLVKTEKKRLIEIFKRLDKLKDPSGLDDEEKRIWEMYSNINEKHKFIEAGKRTRLRFQLGQKDRMIQGIYYSGRYLEDFEKVFREAGVPMELTRLVFVESSFNVLARSKVGASGLWQQMRYTAKPYMMINNAIDKRNHPMEATRLAAKLLKINYSMLKDWPLAVTGWNHGPTGILRLTKKHKTRDLGELVQNFVLKKRFGFASRNFYASFLAALEVEKNASRYLGSVSWSQPLESSDIRTPVSLKYSEILAWFDGDDLRAQIFNPHLNRPVRKGTLAIPKGAILSLPKAKYDEVVASLNDLEQKEVAVRKVRKRN